MSDSKVYLPLSDRGKVEEARALAVYPVPGRDSSVAYQYRDSPLFWFLFPVPNSCSEELCGCKGIDTTCGGVDSGDIGTCGAPPTTD